MKYKIPPQEYARILKETEVAIQKGSDNAKAEWKVMVLEILYNICLSKKVFTVNNFRKYVSESDIKTHDNRAMGGVIRTAVKYGWIKKTGNTITSRVGHLSPLQIWRSLIFDRSI